MFALFEAIHDKNIQKLRLLIQQGVDSNTLLDFDRFYRTTPLNYACKIKCNMEIVSLLLKQGAKVNLADEFGKTPLDCAVLANNVETIKLLVKHGANVNTDLRGRPLLYNVAENENSFETVKCLIENGADINKICKEGTLLHSASVPRNNIETIKFCIQNGLKINDKNHYGHTPLHIAARLSNNIKTLEFLLENGADANITDNDNRTSLHKACGQLDNLETIKLLLKNDADINVYDKYIQTPLSSACRIPNNIAVLKFLFEEGATVDPELDGSLHCAVLASTNTKNVEFLLENGANVNAKNHSGETALMVAFLRKDNFENVKLLFDHGADIKVTDNYGNTCLHHAIFHENTEKLEFLIENGADIQARNIKGYTALLKALYWGKFWNVRVLLNKGADAYCDSETFKHLFEFREAEDDKFEQSVSYLLKYLMKKKVLNLLNDKTYATWKSKFHKVKAGFEVTCRKEAEEMEKKFLHLGRRITLVDILNKNANTVANYFKLEGFKERVDNINLNEKFPNYSEMLKYQIKEAAKLFEFFEEGFICFQNVLNNIQQPPYLVYTKIYNYLDRDDIKKLKEINKDVVDSHIYSYCSPEVENLSEVRLSHNPKY